jgi:hypothetical protein
MTDVHAGDCVSTRDSTVPAGHPAGVVLPVETIVTADGFTMKLYHGRRTDLGCTVVVEDGDESRDLDPRFNLRNHSPTGLEWGYSGSGPAQLAADVLGHDERAQEAYQSLKFKLIAQLPHEGWTLTENQLRHVIDEIEQSRDRAR